VQHMADAPDISTPDTIRGKTDDPRVQNFIDDPVLVVVHWTDDLRAPTRTVPNRDYDLEGHLPSEIAEHQTKLDEFIATIDTNLAQGRYVVVRGWTPECTTTWDIRSIEKFKGSMNQLVEYQGNIPSFPLLCIPIYHPLRRHPPRPDIQEGTTQYPQNHPLPQVYQRRSQKTTRLG
jgi:hypothetical protein